MKKIKYVSLLALACATGSLMAQHTPLRFSWTTTTTSSSLSSYALVSQLRVSQPTVSAWMSPEVGSAWNKGYMGQGTTIHVLDQFSGTPNYRGNLTGASELQTHGYWVLKEASMVAPLARSVAVENTVNTPLVLMRGLNVVNLSYQVFGAAGQTAEQFPLDRLDTSVVNHAKNGAAVVVKAAGNHARAVNTPTPLGNMDYINLSLRGAKSAMYVGALASNGSVAQPATMAGYSNTAGTDPVVQKQFLVVGVDSAKTDLYGTSFAAPIISGYASILGSKFTRATPTQITNQLLLTARKDTIASYNVVTHGQGEASLSRALAPVALR
jgi:subtilisin family serine protease